MCKFGNVRIFYNQKHSPDNGIVTYSLAIKYRLHAISNQFLSNKHLYPAPSSHHRVRVLFALSENQRKNCYPYMLNIEYLVLSLTHCIQSCFYLKLQFARRIYGIVYEITCTHQLWQCFIIRISISVSQSVTLHQCTMTPK